MNLTSKVKDGWARWKLAHFYLRDIQDVDVSSTPPADGDTLVWVDADKKWEPGAAIGSFFSWRYEEFHAPTDYQLTVLPMYLSPSVVVNGTTVLRENTDYTIDYGLGLISITASLTSGDVIAVRYMTDLTLIASTPQFITDNFNRTNSATTLNPASDGGSWTIDDVFAAYGILSNQAYIPNAGSGTSRARRDTHQTAADITITSVNPDVGAQSHVEFAYDPVANLGYQLSYSGGATVYVHRWHGSQTLLGSLAATSWTGGQSRLRATYDPATGVITVYQDGVLLGSVTDTTPITAAANSWVGFSSTGSTGETWDDFKAVTS